MPSFKTMYEVYNGPGSFVATGAMVNIYPLGSLAPTPTRRWQFDAIGGRFVDSDMREVTSTDLLNSAHPDLTNITDDILEAIYAQMHSVSVNVCSSAPPDHACGDHRVDVGFTHSKFVCKLCDKDMP